MSIFHLFIVALIQGVTEFLPISSSGHLILLPNLTGMEDQGQVIDVAVHVGTLFAVMLYFRVETASAFRGLWHLSTARFTTQDARLALALVIATIPVVIVGIIFAITGVDDQLRNIAVIGWAMLIFGIVLYWADQYGPDAAASSGFTLKNALILGLWQAIALIPGTSRSGITITGARFLGYERSEAARIAMLMSIPTIIASGVFSGAEVIADADMAAARDGAIAAILAFLAALASLAFMMRLLRSVSFTPYVIYRVILGVVLLVIAYS